MNTNCILNNAFGNEGLDAKLMALHEHKLTHIIIADIIKI